MALCLAAAGEGCAPVHVVAAGAGTGAGVLLANNPNVDANIYFGEVLCTAATVVVASA